FARRSNCAGDRRHRSKVHRVGRRSSSNRAAVNRPRPLLPRRSSQCESTLPGGTSLLARWSPALGLLGGRAPRSKHLAARVFWKHRLGRATSRADRRPMPDDLALSPVVLAVRAERTSFAGVENKRAWRAPLIGD